MKRRILLALASVTMISAGVIAVRESVARGRRTTDANEQRVHANLMRVRINGKWEEFAMMPMADAACRSQNELYQRYCD